MDKKIDVVVKDGNRAINWQFPVGMRLEQVLEFWSNGYYPYKRDTVRLNGRRLLAAHLECRLSYFAERFGKLVFQVESIEPKKEDVG